MKISMNQFEYFKRHPDVLIEELFGEPLTQRQKELLRALTSREDFLNIVQVTRCKDCKWFGEIGCAIEIVDDSDKPGKDDFCSKAERRE